MVNIKNARLLYILKMYCTIHTKKYTNHTKKKEKEKLYITISP